MAQAKLKRYPNRIRIRALIERRRRKQRHTESQESVITVIIPVLNESEKIVSVIQPAKSDPRVTEVIVIDDGSIDGSPNLAASADTTVIACMMLGKGVSMEEGVSEV